MFYRCITLCLLILSLTALPLRADDPPANAGGAAGAVTPENNTDQGETDSAAEATQVSDAPEPVNIATLLAFDVTHGARYSRWLNDVALKNI